MNILKTVLPEEQVEPIVQDCCESRRNFLKRAGVSLAVIATASVGYADSDGDDNNSDDNRGNMNSAVGKGQVDVGAVSNFNQQIMTNKTSIAGVMIAQTAQGLIALSPVCTHQGCAPDFSKAAKQFICRCHGARFAADGAVTAGPARTPLSRYPMIVKNGRLIVDTNNLIKRSSVKPSDFLKI